MAKTASGSTIGSPGIAERRATRTRAVLVDDQLVFRLGLRIFLSRALPEVVVMGEASSGEEGILLAERIRPDLLLLDASLPESRVDEMVRRLLAVAPHVRIVVLANLPDTPGLAAAVSAGAHGCLLKTIVPEQLVFALRQVIAGGKWVQPELRDRFAQAPRPSTDVSRLSGRKGPAPDHHLLTRREMEVLRLVAAGHSNAQIARDLGISEQTVKTHLAHLMRKLEVRSRLQVARYAITRGLVEV